MYRIQIVEVLERENGEEVHHQRNNTCKLSRLKSPSTMEEKDLYQDSYDESRLQSLKENHSSSQRKETGHRD